LAQQALKRKPKHQLATYVVARLLARESRSKEAIELLEGCLDRRAPQPEVLSLLAGLKLKAQQYDEAAELYAVGERLDPHNLKWTRALGRVYLLSENQQKLRDVFTRLARADPEAVSIRKRLARMALDEGDFAAAADWSQAALEIDVTDAEVHQLFAEALVGRHNWVEANEEYETAVELSPAEPHLRLALAEACIKAGKPEGARRVLRALLKLAPDHPAEGLLEEIERIEEAGQP